MIGYEGILYIYYTYEGDVDRIPDSQAGNTKSSPPIDRSSYRYTELIRPESETSTAAYPHSRNAADPLSV